MLVSVIGTMRSMHLSWGPVTHLYSQHVYAMIKSPMSLNIWVTVMDVAIIKLLFRQGLPRVKVEGSICPPTEKVSIRMSSDAIKIG